MRLINLHFFTICFLSTLLSFPFAYGAYAQSTSKVEGAIVDTSSALKLENAIVMVLGAKDSIFIDHSRANAGGRFVFNILDLGEYILVAIYPNYLDFVERFTLDSERQSVDFGEIDMMLVSELLDEVVITSRNAITIKGDTIEFDASKYTLQNNARVEDLLRQLPGFQVNMNGKITALGETISKVLVDGEEFFGDDPTLVTRNIRADMVDKVQLYNKKSDQAAFTGIDDGKETKTVNIQLKEDRRHGTFGKMDAGGGTDGYYTMQAMANTFKGDRKFAAYGTLANNGTTDLGWQNSSQFVGSFPSMGASSGAVADALDSYDGGYNGEGIPVARNGGVHYDTKWNNKKESINANYKIGSIDVTGDNNIFNQNDLPSGLLISKSIEEFNRYAFRHKADAHYQVEFDPTSTLSISLEGTKGKSRTQSGFESSSENGTGNQLNQSSRNISNKGNSQLLIMDALWNKRLGKPGRTISVRLNQTLADEEVTGFLFSESDFYNNDILDSIQVIDQQKRRNGKQSVLGSNIVYTEPISEFFKLGVDYQLSMQNEISRLYSYNESGAGSYNSLDSLYSSDFKLNRMINEIGATLNFEKEKHVVSGGLRIGDDRYKHVDRFRDDVLERSFSNFNPNLRWNYTISDSKSLSLDYAGQTLQPTLSQIQPVRSNNDPLNIEVGNPDLDPSWRQNLQVDYRSTKRLTGTFLSFSLGGATVHNGIISDVHIDEAGKSVYRFDNLTDEVPFNLNTELYYGGDVKKFSLGARLGYHHDQQYHIINDVLNKIRTNRTNLTITFSRYQEGKYNFILEGGPIYFSDASSLQKISSSEGWGGDAFFGGTLYLPGKLEFKSENSYKYSQATQVFDQDFERLLINMSLSKKFLKSEALMLRISANDILDRNVGFRRTAYSTGFSQTNYSTVRRHFMFSLIWDFNTMGDKDN